MLLDRIDARAGRPLAARLHHRRDGAVEAVFAGPEAAVTAMVEACRKGPLGARVDVIEEGVGTPEELALRGSAGFAVLPTA